MSHTDEYALKLLRRSAPTVLRSLTQAAQHEEVPERTLILALSQFEDNPLVLYAALRFARAHGVTVTFTPAAQPPPS